MSVVPGTAFQAELRSEFCSTARHIGDLGLTGDLSLCSVETIAQAKSEVLHAAAVELARFLQSLNAQSRFVGIAPELLAEIFGHLTVRDRFSATEVCHRWRSVALGLPHVWADLTDFGFVSHKLTLALERARGHSVRLGFFLHSIAVNYGPSVVRGVRREDQHSVNTVAFLQCMATRVQQIVTLDIRVYGAAHSLPPLHDALSRPAPNLQSFRLQIFAPGCEMRNDILAGSAPQLRTLDLSHVLPSPQATCFRGVRRLVLKISATQELELPTILTNFPTLVEFELDVDSQVPFIYDPARVTAHALSVLVPKLEILRLYGDTRWMLMFPFTDYRLVSVLAPVPPISEALWDRCSQPTRLVVLSEPNRAVFIGGANDGGFIRLVSNAFSRDDARRLFNVSTTSSLRAFVTDTRTWIDAVHPAVVELPQLKYLHVVTYVQEGSRDLCQRLPDWLRVPALRVLRISAVAIPEALPHCSHDVARAVDYFVTAITAPNLAFIELEDVEVQNVPARCIRRRASIPLTHFLPKYVYRFGRWDAWMESALRRIPDI